jgi:hypothetical protein
MATSWVDCPLRAVEGSFAKSRVDLQAAEQVASLGNVSTELVGRSVQWIVVENVALPPSSGGLGKCYPVAFQVGVVAEKRAAGIALRAILSASVTDLAPRRYIARPTVRQRVAVRSRLATFGHGPVELIGKRSHHPER